MTRFLTGIIAAGALLAVSSGVAIAQEYPPCTAERTDKCTQVPRAQMQKEMKKEMGGEMMKKEKSMQGDSDIPRGCSPVTTPCE